MHLPTTPQTILPRIIFISSKGKVLLYGHPPNRRLSLLWVGSVQHVNHYELRGAAAASKLLQTRRAISYLSLPMPDVK